MYKNNTNQYTVIDALSYRYNGNQLVNVSDTCTHSLLYSNSFEYVNDNEGLSETEYTYDGNGNMTSDLNKGISSITYDKLNNPSRISYSNGKMMDYDYSADGRKLSTTYVSVLSPLNPPIFPIIHSSDNILEQPSLPSAHVIQDRLVSTASVVSSLSPLASTIMTHNAHNIRSISTTEYFGNYIFENGYLSTILLDDGYISFSVPNNSYILLTFDVPYTAPTFHFYLKDHLGSIRVVVSDSGSVEQINNYYPYGGMIGDLSTGQWKHPYKYNGKEYETMYGLNTYDYGARQYDPARITWDRMDQLCEEKPWNNPYVFCGGNPINRIDPDGMDWYSSLDSVGCINGRTIWETQIHYTECTSQKQLKENNIDGTYLGETVVLFDGSYNEKLGTDNTIDGPNSIHAIATVYGAKGPDDITQYTAFTMSSNYEKYGAIQDSYYDVSWRADKGRGSIPKHYRLENGGPINTYDGNRYEGGYSKYQKNGIFIHRTNMDGTAGDGLHPVSLGCLLIKAQQWKSFENHVGRNPYKIILRRKCGK